ncbi:glycosyltransferase family 2 protein [Geobacillus thermodenitrificans]|uniref:glycosyltransferase family 2 protein n=1 Tax=Geobacillus thermodenitrificans TaxID=33940 RepID=UPI003D1A9025
MSSKVSIIIPVYNIASYLEECLYSVQNQSYRDLEVIMINDGSTDGSEQILERFQKNDPRFRLFNQENRGLGYTRNRGISLSNGQYVFFLDGDDRLPKDAIQHLLSAIETHDADYAVGKVLRFHSERKYVPIRHLEFNLYTQKQVTTIEQNPELLQDSIACNKLWKKEFLIQNDLSFIEGKYYEDLFFTMRAAVLAKTVAVTNKVVYYWRVRTEEHNRSITQEQMKLENTLHRLSALKQNRQWLIDNRVSAKVVEQHDLKCLIDVLRLHAVKFALVDQTERKEWQENVLSFLQEIPRETAQQLAPKEKMLYDLILNYRFDDLEKISEVYMNIETSPVVEQEGHRFFVRVQDRTYDITADIKPIMTVEDFQKQDDDVILSGELVIPKASQKVNGYVYVARRGEGEKIDLGTIECKPKPGQDIYPCERQTFRLVCPIREISRLKTENVYDFYYRIDGDERVHRPSRVRLKSTAKHHFRVKAGLKIALFYRTDYGNLSLKFSSDIGIKRTIKKLVSFFKF